MRNQTAIRILFALLAASVLSAQGSQAQLQRFSLQNREYRFENGKWYRFLGEQKGDEIIPLRLLVRLKNRGTMEPLTFNG